LCSVSKRGKPIGARFPSSEIRILEIVKAKGLEIHPAYNEEWAAIGMQLPAGRIYVRGKHFLPPIKQALYDQLRGAVPESATAPATGEARDSNAKTPAAAATPLVASGFPRTWDEVAPGHCVLAEESLPEGLWRAIVTERSGDLLTLRYRDYPKADLIKRHIATIGLLNPNVT